MPSDDLTNQRMREFLRPYLREEREAREAAEPKPRPSFDGGVRQSVPAPGPNANDILRAVLQVHKQRYSDDVSFFARMNQQEREADES